MPSNVLFLLRWIVLTTFPVIILVASTMQYHPTHGKFETVGMIPKSYFENEHVIYGFTERVIDGDTIRVRHIPNYILKRYILQKFHKAVFINMMTPLQQRGIAQETLSIRVYGVDCPELSKKKSQASQPFAIEAKEFTTQLCHHQIVKITLLRKDQYQRAVAKVEVLTHTNRASSFVWPRRKRNIDLSMELAQAGLAELYTGGGAEYHHSYDRFVRAIHEARRLRRGIWSIPTHQYVSAAEYKERRPPAPVPSAQEKNKVPTKKRVNGYVVDATSTTTTPATARTKSNTLQSRTAITSQNSRTSTTMMTLGTKPTTSTTSSYSENKSLTNHRRSKPKRLTRNQKKPNTSLFETALTGLEILG